ncbi:MAG: 30S ribosomal protein S17 [Candidatus Hydrogenedens sp.]|nr:30S ribosomal protein S17 [Candidatus Hydrogenedentota bacterium]NLF56918.1 30S ribosomal protein S17 [Candidatus Hydrogenedens sp.]
MEDQVKGAPEETRGHRKERVGVVTSNKMDKTITVAVEGVRQHRLYKKALKRTKKFKAHDEDGQCGVGDVVRIRETRPLSATKRWRLVEIVKRAD